MLGMAFDSPLDQAMLLGVVLLHVLLWIPAVVLLFFFLRKKKTRTLDWTHVAVSLLLLALFYVPEGYWQRPFIHLNGLPKDPERFFIHAAATGDAGLLELLLDKGVEPKPALLNEAFFNAGMEGQLAAMQFLLQRKADIDYQQGGAGSTALMSAAALGHTEAVRFLLANRADATLKDRQGKTALDKARRFDRQEVATILEGHARAH